MVPQVALEPQEGALLVVNQLVCGLEAYVLAPTHLRRLQRQATRLLRALSAGRACKRTADEGYEAKGAPEVRRSWRMCTIAVELRVRRLKLLASWARQPSYHVQVVAAVWGATSAELEAGVDRRVLDGYTPWATQFLSDLQALSSVSDEADDILAPDFDFVRVLADGEERARFAELDMGSLRSAELGAAVAPLGYRAAESESDGAASVGEGDRFVCMFELPSGAPCLVRATCCVVPFRASR